MVKIPETVRRFRKQNDVVRLLLLVVLVCEIALHTVDDFDAILAFAKRFHRSWKRLHDAVIRDGDGGPAPAVRRAHEVGDGIDGIHRAHRRMRMELDALFLCRIFARFGLAQHIPFVQNNRSSRR